MVLADEVADPLEEAGLELRVVPLGGYGPRQTSLPGPATIGGDRAHAHPAGPQPLGHRGRGLPWRAPYRSAGLPTSDQVQIADSREGRKPDTKA
jgi:hypothetical protein